MSTTLRISIGTDGQSTKITDAQGNEPITGISALSITVAGNEPSRAVMLIDVAEGSAEIEASNADWCVMLNGKHEKISGITLADGRVIDFSEGFPIIT